MYSDPDIPYNIPYFRGPIAVLGPDPKPLMTVDTSDCFQHFGYEDFETDRVKLQYPAVCPIRDCSTTLISIPDSRGERPFCPAHGIRLHSNTFVYWNGVGNQDEARLRNFRIRLDLARDIALGSVEKAESHRLGYEMSEDALTWNVFVGLAEAGKLRRAVQVLTGRDIDAEPSLYLWGELIDVKRRERGRFQRLDTIRSRLENDIKRFKTEPDVMLVLDGQLVICIEAKFGSGNPLANERRAEGGQKPVDRAGLLRRYLDPARPETNRIIYRDGIGMTFHSQLFRNVIFASEMANGWDWHVVNLASMTQWKGGRDSPQYSYKNPEEHVRSYLHRDRQQCFSFRTWEELYRALIKDDPVLGLLNTYVRSKSAHYDRAFDLD